MTDHYDFPLLKRQIEAQLLDYQQELAEYETFMINWRKRQGLKP